LAAEMPQIDGPFDTPLIFTQNNKVEPKHDITKRLGDWWLQVLQSPYFHGFSAA